MGVYKIFETGNKSPLKLSFPTTGRVGISFYLMGREVFLGIEIGKVIIPPKRKHIKVPKATVRFYPTDQSIDQTTLAN